MYWQSYNVIEFMLSIGLPLAFTLALLSVSMIAGEPAARRVRAMIPMLRKQVDEPGDVGLRIAELIVEAVTKQDVDPAKLSAELVRFIDALKPIEGVPLPDRDPNA